MAFCKQCKKWMDKGTGKRAKEFCNETCRSNFWYAKNKKGKGKATDKIEVKETPENGFNGDKSNWRLLDEAGQTEKPLSFEELRKNLESPIQLKFMPLSPQQVMKKYWDEKRDLTADDYPDWLARVKSDERLNEKQRQLVITTNQSDGF